MASDLLEVTGLWESKDKDGNMILSGNLNGKIRIVIFKNGYKEAENHPDYRMYLSKKEPQESGG